MAYRPTYNDAGSAWAPICDPPSRARASYDPFETKLHAPYEPVGPKYGLWELRKGPFGGYTAVHPKRGRFALRAANSSAAQAEFRRLLREMGEKF